MYTTEELMQIVHHSAGVLGIQAEEDGVREIARRSRGTPRIVNRLLKRVRDYAQVRGDGVITKADGAGGPDAAGRGRPRPRPGWTGQS